jgi:YcaO-like protein with predicted kinase domain
MWRFDITRLADISDLDLVGIPVAQAVRPNSKSLSVSQGKGPTVAAARVAALMEAAELWHSEQPMHCLIDATPAELVRRRDGHAVVDVARLPRRPFAHFDPGTIMRWTEGLSLVSGQPCWVPEVCVSMDETPPRDPLLDVFHVTTAGLACGNHHLEAIAHGVYELVERDAWARAALRRRLGVTLPRIDPGSVVGATTRWMVDRCAQAGLHMVLTDLTNELAIPVILCDLVEHPPNPFRPIPLVAGLACHPDGDSAIAAAIGEAVQSRLGTVAASRDDLSDAVYTCRRNGATDETLEAYLSGPASIDAASLAASGEPSIAEELGAVTTRIVSRLGVDIVVVDLAQPDIGLPVVRVLAAGLRGGGP